MRMSRVFLTPSSQKLTHIAATRFSVECHAGSADVPEVPTVLANRFPEKNVIVFQTEIRPVQRADRSGPNQPTTAQDKEPSSVAAAAVFEIELAFAAGTPGGRREAAIPRRPPHESQHIFQAGETLRVVADCRL